MEVNAVDISALRAPISAISSERVRAVVTVDFGTKRDSLTTGHCSPRMQNNLIQGGGDAHFLSFETKWC